MWTIVRKDLAIELRTGEMASSMFLLALLIIIVFAFTLEPERLVAPEFLAGLSWTTLLVAGTLALNRSFVLEREAGGLTGLSLAPIDRGSIYLAKALGNFLLLLIAGIVLLPLIAILLGTRGLSPTPLLPLVIVLGVAGIAIIGTLCAAIASRTLHRNFMGYTVKTAPDMIGVGVSAIGDVSGSYAQNAKKLSVYYQELDAGRKLTDSWRSLITGPATC
jgi:heme exporter protein B